MTVSDLLPGRAVIAIVPNQVLPGDIGRED